MRIHKPTRLWQLSFQGEWPTCVAFLGNHQRIAAGNRGGQIFVWDLPTTPPTEKAEKEKKNDEQAADMPPSRQLVGHSNCVTHMIATPDGESIFSSSLDRTIVEWDPLAKANGQVEVVLDRKTRERNARRRPRKERDKLINQPGHKVDSVSSRHVLSGHQDWIHALGLSRDGKRLISGDDACLSVVWDAKTRKKVSSWHGYDRVWVRSAALSPDGKTAFTCEYAGRRSSFDVPAAQARLWNADKAQLQLDLLKVWTPKVKDKDRRDTYSYGRTWGKFLKRGLVCAEFSPSAEMLAVGQGGETDTGKVHLIDVKSGKIIRTVSGHRYGVCDVKFSADGKYVLSSGRDTVVRICRVADGKEVAVLGKSRGGQFKDWFSAIAISPDQNFVAAADIAGMVHIWQLAT